LPWSEADAEEVKAAPANAGAVAAKSGDWPMFGGTPARNLVNTVDKNIAAEWSVKEGMRKNVKWVVELGTTSYGTPVVAGGKVFVGTNNEVPRNSKIKGDKGISCARGRHRQVPLARPCMTSCPYAGERLAQAGRRLESRVEGNRLYYVNNRLRGHLRRHRGLRDGKNDGVTDEQYKGDGDADIIWRLDNGEGIWAYSALPVESARRSSPATWCCGDGQRCR